MKPSFLLRVVGSLLSLLVAGCGRKEGYQIKDGKVVWHSWRGDGLLGTRSEAEIADASGFEILQPRGYARNPGHVFHEGARMDGADPTSFHIFKQDPETARDARRVYHRGAPVSNADPATYEPAGMAGLGRDKADYYLRTRPLHVRDLSSFQVLDAEVCGREHHIWARDRFNYYVGEQPTPIADEATFQVIQSWYARDAKQAYFGSQPISGADPATFQGIGGEAGEFAKDARHVYWRGQMVEEADAPSFRLLGWRYAGDAKRAYFCYAGDIPPLVLPDSDGKSFEVLGPSSQGFGYARDARQVYQGANVIDGADPATFVIDPRDPEKASDKNRRYHHGKPLP